MKRTVSVIIGIIVCAAALAQDDSAVFSNGVWSREAVADGIVLKQCAFEGNLFGSNQYISVLEVAPSRRVDIVPSAEKTLEKTSSLAAQYGAVVAVNGSFFNMRAPYGSVNYLRVDGQQLAPNALDSYENSSSGRSTRQTGAIVTFKGQMYVLKSDDVASWEGYIAAEDVVTTGPMLLVGGKEEFVVDDSFNRTRHPRTAIGRRADGTLLLVTVDGRNEAAAGVSMKELQNVMLWLGCSDAINLDGGGSTAMVVNGKVVNHPCDNKKFDAEGERKVANAILVK